MESSRFVKWFKVMCAFTAALWATVPGTLQVLLVCMVADFATGLLAGYVLRELESHISYRGIAKKASILIMIGAVKFATAPLGLDADLSKLVAGFYIASELISILENCGRAGVPVPAFLRNALAKLQEVSGDDKTTAK